MSTGQSIFQPLDPWRDTRDNQWRLLILSSLYFFDFTWLLPSLQLFLICLSLSIFATTYDKLPHPTPSPPLRHKNPSSYYNQPRYRQPRHYHLILRIRRRGHKSCVPSPQFIPAPFDLNDHNHKYLHIPEYTYGHDLTTFTSHIDPLQPLRIFRNTSLFQPTHSIHLANQVLMHAGQRIPADPNRHVSIFHTKSSTQIHPLVFDSGASISITPIKADFIEPLQPSPITSIRNLTGSTDIQYCGKVRWTVTNSDAKPVDIETTALFLPEAEVRLFSPQQYFDEHDRGVFYMDRKGSCFDTGNPTDGTIDVSYEPSNHLPMIIEDMYTQHMNQQQTLPSLLSYSDVDINNVVTSSSNQNLTQSQKHLLRWHQKLGHLGFQWVQTLLRKRQWFEDTIDEHGKVQSTPFSFLPTNDPKAASCEASLCAACRLSRMTIRATNTK